MEDMWLEWLTSKLNQGPLDMSLEELLQRLDSALQKGDGSSLLPREGAGNNGITLADIAAWSIVHDAMTASSTMDLSKHAIVEKWYKQLSQEKMFQAGIKAAAL